MQTQTETRSSVPATRKKLPARKGWLRRLLGDILFVAKRDKKWWLLPLIALLLILAALLVFAAVAGPLAPFIYPLL
jgi:hypothetical protein